MQSQTGFRKEYLGGEFLTRTYRISGEVSLHSDPLLDQMNDHMALFIQLERIFISPLLDPVALLGNFNIGQVRKDTLSIVVLNQRKDGLPRREGQYMGRDHVERSLLIMVGGFEVRGVLRLHPSVDVSHFVRTTPEQFIPLFDAQATLAAEREIVFEGGAILINRRQIEVFCMTDH